MQMTSTWPTIFKTKLIYWYKKLYRVACMEMQKIKQKGLKYFPKVTMYRNWLVIFGRVLRFKHGNNL